MDYVLFGIQGSGKGTQGKILAQKSGAHYFEMGGELRALAKQESELGQKVKSIIDAGNLVPTDVVMEIVENYVHTKAEDGTPIIFDGIPRSEEQRVAFEELLQKLEREYTGLFFTLGRDDAIARLTSRRICSIGKEPFPADFEGDRCEEHGGELITRADDNAESIGRRLDLFDQETMPIIDMWRNADRMIEIDAAPPIEQVTENLMQKLNA